MERLFNYERVRRLMRHFNYFENGGPAPSSCLSCGNPKQLFDLGREIPVAGGMAQICRTCVIELAITAGYAEKAPLDAEIAAAKSTITNLEEQLAKVPTQVDGLINGIRSSVTDFIFAISYSDNAGKPEVVSDVPSTDSGEHEAVQATAGKRKAPSKSVSE